MGESGEFQITAWGRQTQGRNNSRRKAEDIKRIAELRKEQAEPLTDFDYAAIIERLDRK